MLVSGDARTLTWDEIEQRFAERRARARRVSLRIEYHELVDTDLEHAWTWYEGQERGLGDRFLDAIHATVVRASRWPNSGSPVLHLDTLYDTLATTGGTDGTGRAPMMILEVHAVIRAALDHAVARRLVDRNVARDTRSRRRPPASGVARSWTAAELSAFLTAARGQRLYPALHLAAHTGMRRGEIVGLKWSDLSVAHSRLSVSRTLQNVGGRPVEFAPKTRTSRRSVEIDRATLDELRRWRRQLGRYGLPCGPDDWMFCDTTGRFLNPESISQLFTASCNAAACHGSGSTTYATPTRRCRRRRHRHQGRVRTPRSCPPRVHHAHLPTPAARHERRRRRTLRHTRRHRQPVDVYRPTCRVTPGHRLAPSEAGRRRR